MAPREGDLEPVVLSEALRPSKPPGFGVGDVGGERRIVREESRR